MTQTDYDLNALKDDDGKPLHLYPVLLDEKGGFIDGNHRLAADKDWPKETLKGVRTDKTRLLTQIAANTQRRRVTKAERRTQITELAAMLHSEGIPAGRITSEICRLTSFQLRYVQKMVPDVYKQKYGTNNIGVASALYMGQLKTPSLNRLFAREKTLLAFRDKCMSLGVAQSYVATQIIEYWLAHPGMVDISKAPCYGKNHHIKRYANGEIIQ